MQLKRILLFTASLVLVGTSLLADDEKIEGTYNPSITATSSGLACQGLVWDKFEIKGNRLIGGISHSQAGFLRLSGTIAANGTLQNAKAVGAIASTSLKGSISPSGGTGTWSTSDGQCSDTWSATR